MKPNLQKYFRRQCSKVKLSGLIFVILAFTLTGIVTGQELNLEFNSIPVMSTVLLDAPKEGYGLFLDLWEYSIQVDGGAKLPSIRINLEPKSLFLPDDFSMAHMVPQDASHPLYLKGKQFRKLRGEFLNDHLVLDEVPDFSDPFLKTMSSTALTLSGKEILILKDSRGDITVSGVKVKKVLQLGDGARVFVLKKPLFNLADKVKNVFNDIHQIELNAPLGPPLDIDNAIPLPLSDGGIRAPAPPPHGLVQPPAPPVNRLISSPAPPPAPPPAPINRLISSPAPPPAPPPSPVNRLISSPALPPPPVPQPQLVEPAPPAAPPAPPRGSRGDIGPNHDQHFQIFKAEGRLSPPIPPKPRRIMSTRPLPIARSPLNDLPRLSPVAESSLPPSEFSSVHGSPGSPLSEIIVDGSHTLSQISEPINIPAPPNTVRSGSPGSPDSLQISEPIVPPLPPSDLKSRLINAPAPPVPSEEKFSSPGSPVQISEPIAPPAPPSEARSRTNGAPAPPVPSEVESSPPGLPVPISEPVIPPVPPGEFRSSLNGAPAPPVPNQVRSGPPAAPVPISEPELPPVPPGEFRSGLNGAPAPPVLSDQVRSGPPAAPVPISEPVLPPVPPIEFRSFGLSGAPAPPVPNQIRSGPPAAPVPISEPVVPPPLPSEGRTESFGEPPAPPVPNHNARSSVPVPPVPVLV